jgi:hypothetical protein
MHDDVGAVVDRLDEDRRRHRVVDDERNAVAMRHARERLDVADVARRVSDRLAEHRTGVVVDQLLDLVRPVARGEPHPDALARKHMGEQRVGGAVELRYRDDVAAEIGDVEQRIIERGLSGRDAQGLDPALQRRDAALQHVRGGIADAAVAIALGLEIEQRRAVLRAVESIGDGLIDRHRDRLRYGVGLVAVMNSDGLAFHDLAWSSRCTAMPGIRARMHSTNVNDAPTSRTRS